MSRSRPRHAEEAGRQQELLGVWTLMLALKRPGLPVTKIGLSSQFSTRLNSRKADQGLVWQQVGDGKGGLETRVLEGQRGCQAFPAPGAQCLRGS